ncbi:response regulator [Spirosoma fluminis]
MKKYQIVIVENDDDERLFMKEGIEQTGLFDIVAQAENGRLLLEWLETNQTGLPDLILSDLNMPVTNGYEVLEALQNQTAYGHLPVIITSTSSTPSVIAKCLALGAADYLVKPDTFLEYDTYGKELYQRIEQKHLVKNAN